MANKHIPLSALVLLLAATLAARAEGAAQADSLDSLIMAQMQGQNIPGLSLIVLKDGQVIKAKGYGLANRALKTPATPETVYRIASVSKQFIATGIMLLVQDGRLRLDDPIGKYLTGTPPTWRGITIRHLLTHTSGLVREAPGFHPSRVPSDSAVIVTAYRVPLRFEPGEKYEYGNLGYFALAEVIRKVSGRPWSEYGDRAVPPQLNAAHHRQETSSAHVTVSVTKGGPQCPQNTSRVLGQLRSSFSSPAVRQAMTRLAPMRAPHRSSSL